MDSPEGIRVKTVKKYNIGVGCVVCSFHKDSFDKTEVVLLYVLVRTWAHFLHSILRIYYLSSPGLNQKALFGTDSDQNEMLEEIPRSGI
jgi:hypothetical protein